VTDLSYEFSARAKRDQETFDALQDEIADRGQSRQSRLGRKDEETSGRRGRQSSSAASYANQLQYLLANDPVYRAAYEATWDALTEAEATTAAEIAQLEAELSSAEMALQDMRDRAAELPDGTKVFRAADGRVFDEHGNDVTHLSEHIEWTGLEPSWEAFSKQRDHVAELAAQLMAWRAYQTDVLGTARGRLTDPDNPPSKDELDDILKDIESKRPQPSARLDADTADIDQPTEVVIAGAAPTGALPTL